MFTGNIGVNGTGIAGIVLMALGALLALFARKISEKRWITLKTLGCVTCALGALIAVLLGK